MERAFTELWDASAFRGMQRKNDGSIESKKGEYNEEAKVLLNSLSGHIKKMLHEHINGHKVDFKRYEAFIDTAASMGKCCPEDLLYYIIQGVHTGLLPFDRAGALETKLQNEVPIFQMLGYATKPTMEDFHNWGSMFPPDKKDLGCPKEFREWVASNAMFQQRVYERTTKAAQNSKDKWDHDFGQSIAKIGNISMGKMLCSESEEGIPNKELTFYPNMLDGHLEWLGDISAHRTESSPEEFAEIVARQFAYFGVTDAILNSRAYTKNEHGQRFFRLSDSEKNAPPRSGMTGLKSTREISGKIQEIIGAGDDFLKEMMSPKPNSEKLKSMALARADHLLVDPVSGRQDLDVEQFKLEDFFEKMDTFVSRIFRTNPAALEV